MACWCVRLAIIWARLASNWTNCGLFRLVCVLFGSLKSQLVPWLQYWFQSGPFWYNLATLMTRCHVSWASGQRSLWPPTSCVGLTSLHMINVQTTTQVGLTSHTSRSPQGCPMAILTHSHGPCQYFWTMFLALTRSILNQSASHHKFKMFKNTWNVHLSALNRSWTSCFVFRESLDLIRNITSTITSWSGPPRVFK